jgi:hypothetical protein
MQNNPRENSSISDRAAYVLPKDYGYGFRGPSDNIWGLWGADNLTDKICNALGALMLEYDAKLDIIYDEGLEPDNNHGYNRLFFWNATSPPAPLLDLPAAFAYTLAAAASVAVVGTSLIVHFWKRKKLKHSS